MIIMVDYMCRDSVGRGEEEGRIEVGEEGERQGGKQGRWNAMRQ